MDLQNHKIRKQTIELRVKDEEEARGVQDRIGNLYHTVLLPEMGKIFTGFSGENILRIEKLEIDIGTISQERLEQDFSAKVLRVLYDEMARICSERQGSLSLPGQQGSIQGAPDQGGRWTEGRTISEKTSDLELLVHYLRTGIVPWWASIESQTSIEEKLAALLEDYERVEILRHELEKKHARQRIIHQFSGRLILKVLEALGAKNPGRINHLADDLIELHGKHPFTPLSQSWFRFILWDSLLEQVAAGRRQAPDIDCLVRALSLEIETHYNVIAKAIVTSFKEWSRTGLRSTLAGLVAILEDNLSLADDTSGTGKASSYKGGTIGPATGKTKARSILEEESSAALEGQNNRTQEPGKQTLGALKGPIAIPDVPSTSPSTGRRNLPEEDMELESSIKNAGLVLLWPYLGSFFENTGLMRESAFVDEASAMRAIHLLEYLATDKEERPEYLLLLNKLLCGWDTFEPVSRGLRITDAERSEAEKLLSSVISHWQGLKNTSIAGFRHSFLQREGILGKRETGWVLKVEQKPYDVLLEYLPWSISIIRLSWMKTVINVTW